MSFLDLVILWVHLFSAVLFVGGSFFIWLVVVPVSHALAKDESERTQMVGKIAKEFGKITNPILIILVLTGIYNVSWYLPSFQDIFSLGDYQESVLFVKVVLVIILIALIYAHGAYYGRKMVVLAREKNFEALRAIRKTSRVISLVNLTLMIVILVLAVMLQIQL